MYTHSRRRPLPLRHVRRRRLRRLRAAGPRRGPTINTYSIYIYIYILFAYVNSVGQVCVCMWVVGGKCGASGGQVGGKSYFSLM